MAELTFESRDETGRLPRGRRPHPSHQSLRGLDWFIFCLADIQVGFGPFVTVYLTSEKWPQADIGFVLSVGGLVALAGQIPGGALVDAAYPVRVLAGAAVTAIAMSALALAASPIFIVVLAAAITQAAASCVLGPSIAAISLGLVGYGVIGERLGRNACLASIGAGLAAVGMGASGYFFSSRAVFFVTAALCVPTLFALTRIHPREIDPQRAHGGQAKPHPGDPAATFRDLLRNRVLIAFAGCIVLFHLANAAMLPTLAGVLTMRSSHGATALIGACMIVPQVLVAIFSPWVGRQARSWGHKPLLLIAFGALPIRGAMFALVSNPYLLVLLQALDGISAAVLGVMVPLVIADAARGTGHFNLAQGLVGSGIGIGASLSTTVAGYVTDHFGSMTTFLTLAGIAVIGFAFVLVMMPEQPPVDLGEATPARSL
jgi:MFS family permease